jgi:hypothetical protein
MQERLLQLQFPAANLKDATTLIQALNLMMAGAIDAGEIEFNASVTLNRIFRVQEPKDEGERAEDLVLVFIGSKFVAERFFESLAQLGAPYSMEMMVERLLLRCQLTPPPPKE